MVKAARREEVDYIRKMKLTGCNPGEFTCSGGHCIDMEQRCNQQPNCRDKTDEVGCKILTPDNSYNKRMPPINLANTADDSIIPVRVKVSITLLKWSP